MKITRSARRMAVTAGVLGGVLVTSAVAFAGARSSNAVTLPDRLTNAPELSAVVLSPADKAFVQVQFDRGRVTAVDLQARTITVLQRQAGHTWRTQTFFIPSGADIVLRGAAAPLRAVKVRMQVRIEQTASLGSTLAVVRVDAQFGRVESLPPTTTGGAPVTSTGGSVATPGSQHPHFLPSRFSSAPEITAVVYNPASNGFVELVFDRGVITSIGHTSAASTITIQQRQSGHVWRTQTFSIPPTAHVVVKGATSTNAGLTTGLHVRIEQAGPVGGPLAVVRVDAQQAGEPDFPPIVGR